MPASGSSTSHRPANPREIINWTECASPTNTVGNQGDVIVWGDLIFRSWNSGTPAPRYADGTTIPVTDPARFTTPGAFCGDWPMFRRAGGRTRCRSAARRACTSSTSATRPTRT